MFARNLSRLGILAATLLATQNNPYSIAVGDLDGDVTTSQRLSELVPAAPSPRLLLDRAAGFARERGLHLARARGRLRADHRRLRQGRGV